jgi:hypothetical protein
MTTLEEFLRALGRINDAFNEQAKHARLLEDRATPAVKPAEGLRRIQDKRIQKKFLAGQQQFVPRSRGVQELRRVEFLDDDALDTDEPGALRLFKGASTPLLKKPAVRLDLNGRPSQDVRTKQAVCFEMMSTGRHCGREGCTYSHDPADLRRHAESRLLEVLRGSGPFLSLERAAEILKTFQPGPRVSAGQPQPVGGNQTLPIRSPYSKPQTPAAAHFEISGQEIPSFDWSPDSVRYATPLTSEAPKGPNDAVDDEVDVEEDLIQPRQAGDY